MKRLPAFILVFFACSQASSHHSTNANFTQEIIAVEGVIEQVRYVNPHASVLIRNTAADGSATYWLLETVGRTTLDRAGINLQELEVGVQVTASGRKGRRENTMYLQKITFADGSEFVPEPG